MTKLKRVAQFSFFTLIAVLAGLVLQCSSDPAVTGDGGVVDTLLSEVGIKDSIGPKADAAGGGTRKVYKGKTNSSGDFEVCDSKWKPSDPPLAMVWAGDEQGTYGNALKSYNLRLDDKGCLKFDSNMVDANQHVRMVVIH